MKRSSKKAITRVRKMGGTIRTSDIIKYQTETKANNSKANTQSATSHKNRKAAGVIKSTENRIHPRTLYELRDKGILIQISRGVYRLADTPITNPDLVAISARAPNAVVCLISALSFHNITTQIPHAIYIAIPQNTKPPRIDNPPLSVHKFSGDALTAGVEKHLIDGVPVKIYSIEKTIADCFKFRNKIGLDVCIEALKLYKARKKINIQKIINYAKICRVYKIITPHLESIL